MQCDNSTTGLELVSVLQCEGVSVSVRTAHRGRLPLGWTSHGILSTNTHMYQSQTIGVDLRADFEDVIWSDETTGML